MRFYNPHTSPPEKVESTALFPKSSLEEGCARCLDLELLPSVTSVLGTVRQEFVERWRMGEAIKNFSKHGNARMAIIQHYATDSKESLFGTRVHETIHQFTQGIPIEDEEAYAHALPLVDWLQKNECQTLLSEETLACSKSGTAGTIDLVLRDKNGKKILGDVKVVKVSNRFEKIPPLTYRCQLSAYERMLLEIDPEPMQKMSFYLASPFGDLTTPQLTIFRYSEDYYPEFQACLALWHAQYGKKNEKPQREDHNPHVSFDPFTHK